VKEKKEKKKHTFSFFGSSSLPCLCQLKADFFFLLLWLSSSFTYFNLSNSDERKKLMLLFALSSPFAKL